MFDTHAESPYAMGNYSNGKSFWNYNAFYDDEE
jgi:hypothetical protein